MNLLALSLRLYVARPIVLLSWSGSFVSMLARNIIKDTGHRLNLIAVSPLLDEEKPVLSGVVDRGGRVKHHILDVGKQLRMKVVYTLRNPADMALSSELVESIHRHLRSYGFEIASIEFGVVDRTLFEAFSSDIAKAQRYLFRIRFYPTIFVFRGWRVLYPSPSRLIHSSARIASQLFDLNERFMKRAARRLARYVEILSSNNRVAVLDIGANRFVKAFWGEATYGVYGYENAKLLKQLICMGELVNIGKSRGIGFGYIKLLDVKALG